CVAEVHGMDAVGETAGHGGKVVVGAGTEGTRAEAEPVGGAVGHRKDGGGIVSGGNDPGQAENGKGGIVRVDRQLHPKALGGGNDRLKETSEVSAEFGCSDPVVAGQHG